jgi:glycosyltransferase involved in cell wall biosynthesis
MTPPEFKVLLVGDYPPPNGGVATHVDELFRAVRARGGQCEVLDIGKGQLPADGVTPAGSMARFSGSLASFSARGYRIHLHTNGANQKSWVLASVCAAAGRLSGRPALITLHSGLGPAWLAESPARRQMAQAVLGHFGQVIAVNSEIRNALEFPSALVLPAFSREFLQPGAPPAGLAELRAEASPLFCAMIAPRPEYGEEILLHAFEQVHAALPSARLALYGVGSEKYARGPKPEPRGQATSDSRGLATSEARGPRPEARSLAIHGFGELPRPQALALISSCDVFVRPTLADGDSVSVREALALGCAVVATQVGNRPAEVKLVAPGDACALARGLLEAAGEISFRTASAPAADSLDRILVLYGWQQPAAQVPEEEAPCAASAAS